MESLFPSFSFFMIILLSIITSTYGEKQHEDILNIKEQHQLEEENFIVVNILPQIEFQVEQTDLNSNDRMEFQLINAQDFFYYELLKEQELEDNVCQLKRKEGHLIQQHQLKIYSNIISNVLQQKLPQSPDEVQILYLDADQQLFSLSVNTSTQIVGYIGVRNIKFDDIKGDQTLPFQQEEFLKLIQWREQLLCVLNSKLYTIIGETAYLIDYFHNKEYTIHYQVLDLDIYQDILFIALGKAGFVAFNISYTKSPSVQPLIGGPFITQLEWEDNDVFEVNKVVVDSIQSRVFFMSSFSVRIYNLLDNNISQAGLVVPDNQEGSEISQFKIMFVEGKRLIIGTQNGYLEYLIKSFALSSQKGDYQSCCELVKGEENIIEGIKDIVVTDSWILLASSNKICGIKTGVRKYYKDDNKWSQQMNIPMSKLIKVLDNHSSENEIRNSFLLLSKSRISLMQMQPLYLYLDCQALPLASLDNNKSILKNIIEFKLQVASLECITNLEEYKIQIETQRRQIKFENNVLYQSAMMEAKYEQQNACIIERTILISQYPTYFQSHAHAFASGITISISLFFLLTIPYCYYIKYFKQQQKNKEKGFKNANDTIEMLRQNKKNKLSQITTQEDNLSNDSTLRVNIRNSQKNKQFSSKSQKELIGQKGQSSLSSLPVVKNLKDGEDSSNINNNESINNSKADLILVRKGSEQSLDQNKIVQQNQSSNNSSNDNSVGKVEDEGKQLMYLSQAEYQQYLQSIWNSPQFKALSKYDQERVIQYQYEQHLEYQRQLRLEQIKKGGHISSKKSKHSNNSSLSSQQKFNQYVDPILETDSDKKVSTRRDPNAFIKKRLTNFEENLLKYQQKQQSIQNDLNLYITLEEQSDDRGSSHLQFDKHEEVVENDYNTNLHTPTETDDKFYAHSCDSQPPEIINIPLMTLQSISASIQSQQKAQQYYQQNQIRRYPYEIEQSSDHDGEQINSTDLQNVQSDYQSREPTIPLSISSDHNSGQQSDIQASSAGSLDKSTPQQQPSLSNKQQYREIQCFSKRATNGSDGSPVDSQIERYQYIHEQNTINEPLSESAYRGDDQSLHEHPDINNNNKDNDNNENNNNGNDDDNKNNQNNIKLEQ